MLQVVRIRLLNLLERQGVIEDRSELTLLDDDLAEREPALTQLATQRGCRELQRLRWPHGSTCSTAS